MIHSQNDRVVIFNGPATESTAATNAATIDTLGEPHCRIEVCLPPATATNSSASFTSLVLQHGTTTHPSNMTALATGGTEFTIPTHNDTANAGIVAFDVNLANRERILRVVAQFPAAHSTTSYTARFDRQPEVLGTDADQGADEVVYV